MILLPQLVSIETETAIIGGIKVHAGVCHVGFPAGLAGQVNVLRLLDPSLILSSMSERAAPYSLKIHPSA